MCGVGWVGRRARDAAPLVTRQPHIWLRLPHHLNTTAAPPLLALHALAIQGITHTSHMAFRVRAPALKPHNHVGPNTSHHHQTPASSPCHPLPSRRRVCRAHFAAATAAARGARLARPTAVQGSMWRLPSGHRHVEVRATRRAAAKTAATAATHATRQLLPTPPTKLTPQHPPSIPHSSLIEPLSSSRRCGRPCGGCWWPWSSAARSPLCQPPAAGQQRLCA